MLLELLRFLRGYVRFSIVGKYPERFLNITAGRGIRLWKVSRGADFSACMYQSDYLRIRSVARRAGVRLRVLEKSGVPSLIYRYRDRAGLVIGACAFVLTVFVMSLFIWSVDITGLDTVSRSEMLSLLRENGVCVGAFKPALNYPEISREIMLRKREIGWMAINVTGSYASVEIKEEAPAPEVADVSVPCNVKAKRDGVLLKIEALEGETVVTEGSGVIEGQLLIGGVISSETGGTRLVHADGRVLAETTREEDFTLPDTISGLRPDGETAERRFFDVFGLRVPYRIASVDSPHSVADETELQPAPLGITLPVGVVSEKVVALTPYKMPLDDDSAEELLRRQSALYESFALSDCNVTERKYTLSHTDGAYTLHVVYTCVEDIAYSEPIGTDENTR